MRIKLTSVFVSDQEKALQFCSEVLKTDIPMGKGRWLVQTGSRRKPWRTVLGVG